MRVSSLYKLHRDQSELDFVDVDVNQDTPLFVAPHAIRTLPSDWAHECVALLHDFFGTVLGAIRSGDRSKARDLLGSLSEPNEIRLGLSEGRPRGRGMGKELAIAVDAALSRSKATTTGLLTDLEDAILMIEGIGPDIVSDMTTNVIRGPLILYTQEMAARHGIPLVSDVYPGPQWDPKLHAWHSEYTNLPVAAKRPLLLVPKYIVRAHFDYSTDEYYRHYIIPRLRAIEFAAGSELVELLRNGRSRITTKALERKYGKSKTTVAAISSQYPELLKKYKADKAADIVRTYRKDEMSTDGRWGAKLATLRAIPAGRKDATRYHLAAEKLLTSLFFPELTRPAMEQKIHSGRKRVDIVYMNESRSGFFDWIRRNYQCPYIFVECKNYVGDPENPELDQLAGRFSPSRGRVGILLCRKLLDRELFMVRCRDTALDDRGWILPLTDDSLGELVDAREANDDNRYFGLFRDLFESLVM
jgi:hypothetical protein